eukprot:NODE_4446_length_806_cov_26.479524_g4112_i0.p1 GENE.NODE_4446_length_806_cov_26.479524_g4112_i0~~NODE_4446_length_806_cov_26.479524_g4112_i0.p1  ORF type:complete len:237 (-),score=40.06 NODE_4446_length_806_cov_26.479524_g4112_i0:95-763(-)
MAQSRTPQHSSSATTTAPTTSAMRGRGRGGGHLTWSSDPYLYLYDVFWSDAPIHAVETVRTALADLIRADSVSLQCCWVQSKSSSGRSLKVNIGVTLDSEHQRICATVFHRLSALPLENLDSLGTLPGGEAQRKYVRSPEPKACHRSIESVVAIDHGPNSPPPGIRALHEDHSQSSRSSRSSPTTVVHTCPGFVPRRPSGPLAAWCQHCHGSRDAHFALRRL